MAKLPEHVHRTASKGHVYFTFQRGRNTPAAGPRIPLPRDPSSPEFWTAYEAACAAERPQEDTKTVAKLIAAYEASPKFKGLSETTQRDYLRYLKIMGDRLGEFESALVTRAVVQEMHDSLATRPVAAKHMVTVVKALYGWGIRRSFATVNPADDIEFVDHSSLGAEPWPQWSLDLIARHARWEIRTFVALALYTGQRTKDVLAMRLQDIRGDLIPVKQSKTGKELSIPIHRDLAPVVAACRQRGFMQLVPGPRGSALNTDRWRAMWGRELKRAELAPIRGAGLSPHGLRKSAVCCLAEAGCPDGDIAAITGQSEPMVRHYKRLYDQEKVARRAMAAWESAGGLTANAKGLT